MECFLQYWDDLDDLIGALRLKSEQIRRAMLFVLGVLLFGAGMTGGVLLALADPPLALAVVTLLVIWLLNLSLVRPMPEPAPA
ncbi:MAG: hypothetical protein QNI99_04735 [Woeseiaceae bacterium]|nr:hypothetical protein [Woeseiaceae bacterium]